MNIVLEFVGFAAGGIVTSAAMPRVIDIVRDPARARGKSRARNALLVIGNLTWVGYGIAGNALAIAVMCGLSAAFNGVILIAAMHSSRRRTGGPPADA